MVRIPTHRGRIGLLALATVACADSGTQHRPTAQVDTIPGGQVVVTNTGVPVWTPETAWRLEEDLRLGTIDPNGPDAGRLAHVVSVQSDRSGMVYVLDGLSRDIRVFHPSGAFSHTIGRPGQGPGEIAGAEGVVVSPGDTVWVIDARGARYSAFAPDGTFLGSEQRPILRGYYEGSGFLSDGSYLDWGLDPPESPGEVAIRPIRLRPGFQGADSLPPLRYQQARLPGGRGPQIFFSDQLALASGGDQSIWFAHTREYRIYKRDLGGDTTLVFSLAAEPARVSERDLEQVRNILQRAPPELRSQYIDALPDTKPIVHKILTDGAGHILVFVDVAGEPTGTAVDVFRQSGEYLGRMTLPSPVSLIPPPVVVHATPEHLFVVLKDELDVPYVSRFRIVRAAE